MKNAMKLLIKKEEWFEDVAIDIGNRYLQLLDKRIEDSTFELWENGAINLKGIELQKVVEEVLLENQAAELTEERFPKSIHRLQESVNTYVDDMLREEGWKIGLDEKGFLVLGPATSDKITQNENE